MTSAAVALSTLVPSLEPAAIAGTLLWTAPLAVPLLAALLAPLLSAPHRHPLAVAATLPALLFAMVPPAGPGPDLSWLLLDLELGIDPPRRLLLAAIALVWLAGSLAARELLTSRIGTATVWLLALTGNLGVVLADDLITLYAAFAVMTFAAYPLVVHDRSLAARRAGRVYLVLSLFGEALLLSGLIVAASRAGATSLSALADAVAIGQIPTVALAMMGTGFAVKVGVLPLHLWLPLAHPAAPVPASAVLSGAMLKAGVVGWLGVLALEAGPPQAIGRTLVVAGVVSILLGALLGVAQDQVKVVLAYSSISQLGFITVIVGVGATDPTRAVAATTAVAAYVLHHGLAKAALFLSVGVRDLLPRRLVLGGSAFAGLALAGAPLTSGYLAKQAAKDTVALLPAPVDGQLTLALSIGAVGTTLLIARVLVLLDRSIDDHARDRVLAPRWSPPVVAWTGLLAGVAAATWVLPGLLTDTWPAPRLTTSAVIAAIWPVLVGVGLGTAVGVAGPRLAALRGVRVPPGDLVVPVESLVRVLGGRVRRGLDAGARSGERLRASVRAARERYHPLDAFVRFEERATRWRAFGLAFLLVLVALLWGLQP